MVVQMEAEDVSNEVRQYSILVGFLLIIIFVVPCVGFALFSKYCQKQTRRKRHSTVSSLIQLQHRSSSLMRHFPPPPEMVPVRESPSDSSDHCSYGPLGQVDCHVDNLECLERMGAMGTYLACLDTWKGRVPPGVSDDEAVGKLIVVKKISVTEAKVHVACLKNDLNTLTHIPPHPMLLNMLGVCMSGGVPQALMLEYPPHGSLHTLLILKRRAALSGNTKYWPAWTNRDRLPDIFEVKTDPSSLSPLLADPDIRCHPYSQPLNSCFTEVDLLLFALQVAAAMDHLTSRNILHRSLSSENILIGSEFFLKLTGMHTTPSQHHATPFRTLKRTASGRNLYKWDAPEVMETGEHSEKTEVWRFGMTIWEVTSLGDVPFAEIPNRSLSDILRSGQRPQAPDSCSQDLYNLMTDCWSLHPESRPTFSRIMERIQDMICFRPDRSCDSDSMHRSVSPLCSDFTPPDHSHLHHRTRPKRPLIYTQYVHSHNEHMLLRASPLPELESEELPDGYLETDV